MEPFQAEQAPQPLEPVQRAEKKIAKPLKNAGNAGEEDRTNDFRCDKCDVVIPQKVWEYSMEHCGRPLCYKCQRVVKSEQEGGRR